MSYRGPRAKLSRRLGVPLTDKASRIMIRKPYPPGQHGQRRRRTASEFGKQLAEKQKLKFQYNISEKQLRRAYAKASAMKGNSADNLIRILERRLDNIVYRSGFAPTIYSARQLVSHGHIFVNGKRLNKASYFVRDDDTVTVREASRKIPIITDAIGRIDAPPYIECNKGEYSSKFAREPERTEVPVICDLQLVIELYSR